MIDSRPGYPVFSGIARVPRCLKKDLVIRRKRRENTRHVCVGPVLLRDVYLSGRRPRGGVDPGLSRICTRRGSRPVPLRTENLPLLIDPLGTEIRRAENLTLLLDWGNSEDVLKTVTHQQPFSSACPGR